MNICYTLLCDNQRAHIADYSDINASGHVSVNMALLLLQNADNDDNRGWRGDAGHVSYHYTLNAKTLDDKLEQNTTMQTFRITCYVFRIMKKYTPTGPQRGPIMIV